MALKPVHALVLIKPDVHKSPYEQEDHKIVLPDKYSYGPWDVAHTGTVVSKGPDVKIEIKSGDSVVYGKFSFAKLNYKEKDYVLVRQEDILAVRS